MGPPHDSRGDMGLTIVVSADIAGVSYKETLETDESVTKVIDVGFRPGENIDYPYTTVGGAPT